MKRYFSILLVLILSQSSFAQNKPKLVVGIVVDQMTNDYLNRFWNSYSETGFKRMIQQGYYYPNTLYNYVPSQTGPGHATIFTGTNPNLHGIAANRWYSKSSRKIDYCVEDNSMNSVGTVNNAGKRSPQFLVGSTMSDMLRIQNNMKSKVVGISLKDRSAILSVGHSANNAFWWDGVTGKWVSSTYYQQELPAWLNSFEQSNPATGYLKIWSPVISPDRVENYQFHDIFEEPYTQKGPTTFPYDFKALSDSVGINVLKSSPFGNSYTFDVSKAAIVGEKMGSGGQTDFLAVSFASTDYIGHQFGPHSAEIEDTYIRFDKELSEFLLFLDEKIGKDSYVIFLTSDHGVMPNAGHLIFEGQKANRVDFKDLSGSVADFLKRTYSMDSLLVGVLNEQVYFDRVRMKKFKVKEDEAARKVVEFLMEREDIQMALSSHDVLLKSYEDFPRRLMQNGYNKEHSGDVTFILKPFSADGIYSLGAEHGSPYVYDLNVPLIFYGPGFVRSGKSYRNIDVTQIASTMSDVMQIQRPPACVSESLLDDMKK